MSLSFEYVAPSSLIPYAKNARRHSPEQVSMIAASIKEFGFTVPILVRDDMTLIAGHGRLEAAQKLGLDRVPIVKASHLTEAQARALVHVDNQIALKSTWDFDLLRMELDDIKFNFEPYEFDLPDFEVSKEGNTDDDAVPEVDKNLHGVVLGDVWKLGDHRVMCGDSTDILHLGILMETSLADCVWTDPPYNVALGMETVEQAKSRNRRTDGLVIKNDKMKDGDFKEFLNNVFISCCSAMRDGASFYIAHADSEGLNFRSSVKEGGLLMKQCLIWVKSSLVMGRQDYQWRHEPILYGWKGNSSHSWYSDRKQTTVLEFEKPFRNELHPTMKPVELVEYCLKNSSKVADIVLDLFLGSGSTLIACEKTGRKCYGMELDPHYCSVIIERWQQFTGKKAERLT